MKKLVLASALSLLIISVSANAIPAKQDVLNCPTPATFFNDGTTTSILSGNANIDEIFWYIKVTGISNGSKVTLTSQDAIYYTGVTMQNGRNGVVCSGNMVRDGKSYPITARSISFLKNCTVRDNASAMCEVLWDEK